jgi:hypothetical protein
MGFTVIFNQNNYKSAIRSGNCRPPNVLTPFITVDWKKYEELRENSRALKVDEIRERLSTEMYANIRGAMGFTLRYARNFFPAYRFFVNEYLNDEWLATVDWHKFHRDHVIHQPMAVYVGMSLLQGRDLSGQSTDKIEFLGSNLLDHCMNSIHNSPKCSYLKEYLKSLGGSNIYFENTPRAEALWRLLFLDTFFLATLFHDMGYPWQFVHIVNKQLRPLFPLEDPSTQDAKWIVDHYGNQLLFYPINGYKKPDHAVPSSWQDKEIEIVKKALYETHGFSGALSLLYLNEILQILPHLNTDKPERRFCLEWAAMAVMMHDMTKIYSTMVDPKSFQHNIHYPDMRLSIDRDPLSYILTLTDQIQDFGRPDANFKKGDNSDESIATYYSKCKAVRVELDDTKILKITFTYEEPGIYIKNHEKYLPENEVKYFDPHNGYLDYRDLGISQVKLIAELEKA